MKDQWRLFGVAGSVEDFEHGEGVVAGGDFLDQASGEGGGGAIYKHGGAVRCPRNTVETFISRAGELTDNASMLRS